MTDPAHIFAWRRLDARTTTSGQPTEAQLADLGALGVTHVVNLALHTHERALPDERESLAALGIAYIHIPVDFASPTDEDFASFAATMWRLEGRTVHVHCILNARVSAFFHRYRREELGWSRAAADPDLHAIWRPEGVWADFVGR